MSLLDRLRGMSTCSVCHQKQPLANFPVPDELTASLAKHPDTTEPPYPKSPLVDDTDTRPSARDTFVEWGIAYQRYETYTNEIRPLLHDIEAHRTTCLTCRPTTFRTCPQCKRLRAPVLFPTKPRSLVYRWQAGDNYLEKSAADWCYQCCPGPHLILCHTCEKLRPFYEYDNRELNATTVASIRRHGFLTCNECQAAELEQLVKK